MEPRKVQKVGYSTLSVSLPMNWAKRMGIKKGDIVFLSEEKNGTLRLTVKPSKGGEGGLYVVDVDACENSKILARVIVANYILGRGMIRVQSSKRLMREQIESIREVTQRLLGIGIIEESDQHLLLQSSIDPKDFSPQTVLRRLYVLTSTMFKEVVDSLADGDVELSKDAITREHEADMIYWLLARLLASAQQSAVVAEDLGIRDPMQIIYTNLIAWFLEMIGDRIQNIANNIIKFYPLREGRDNELLDRLSQLGLMTFTMFDKAVNSLFNGNLKIASDAIDLKEIMEREERSLLKEFQGKLDTEAAVFFSSILWELRIIAEHSAAVAEIAIDNILKGETDICRAAS
ncbi:AbrB/MazE/SpoVT family DNA-binding domain-containing protein [Candidatus Bathyarchaeota archaeon]|nr:AbrB/MazE/SpoVT family DNA-binding domain-containing protein [Candidatus Bathyarchaeota archaeon]